MRHPWLTDISNDIYEQKTAKHRSFQKLPAAREHDKICEHIKSLATLDEINDALKAQKFNFLTGKFFEKFSTSRKSSHRTYKANK